MSAYLVQAVALLAALAIFFRVELIMNAMDHACRLPVRVAFWLLAVGTAWLMLSITQGYQPPPAVALLLCGLAALLIAERRVRCFLRASGPVRHERRMRP